MLEKLYAHRKNWLVIVACRNFLCLLHRRLCQFLCRFSSSCRWPVLYIAPLVQREAMYALRRSGPGSVRRLGRAAVSTMPLRHQRRRTARHTCRLMASAAEGPHVALRCMDLHIRQLCNSTSVGRSFSESVQRRDFSVLHASPQTFATFVDVITAVESAGQSRLKREEILQQYFLNLLESTPDAVAPAVALLTNQLGKTRGLPLRLGRGTVQRAIAAVFVRALDSTTLTAQDVGSLVRDQCGGDVGKAFLELAGRLSDPALLTSAFADAAAAVLEEESEGTKQIDVESDGSSHQSSSLGPVNLATLFTELQELGGIEGKASDTTRVHHALRILDWIVSSSSDCSHDSKLQQVAAFLRLLTGERLKIGAADVSVIRALSAALITQAGDHEGDKVPADAVAALVAVYKACPSVHRFLDIVSEHVAGRNNTPQSLASIEPAVSLFYPFESMLALPSKSTQAALAAIKKHFSLPPPVALGDDHEDTDDAQASPYVLCDFKYDGMRAQLHVDLGDTSTPPSSGNLGEWRLFSRSCDDITGNFEALIDASQAAAREQQPPFGDPTVRAGSLCPRQFVLDGEIVMVDRSESRVRSFADFVNRKSLAGGSSTHIEDGGEVADTHSLSFAAFDILQADGRNLAVSPLAHRRKLLEDMFQESTAGSTRYLRPLFLAESTTIEIPDSSATDGANAEDPEVTTFEQNVIEVLQRSQRHRCDGVVIKGPQGEYDFGNRRVTNGWLKLKHDFVQYLSEDEANEQSSSKANPQPGQFLADSLDLVVMGAYFGKGKRQNVLGSFLLGAWDPESLQYEAVCKVGTGFSDADLQSITERLREGTGQTNKPLETDDTDAVPVPAPVPVPEEYSVPKRLLAPSAKPDVWFAPSNSEVSTAHVPSSESMKIPSTSVAW